MHTRKRTWKTYWPYTRESKLVKENWLLCIRGFSVRLAVFAGYCTTSFVCFQVVSYGFILHEGSFCRSSFNLLDMLVVAVSILAIVFRYVHFTVRILVLFNIYLIFTHCVSILQFFSVLCRENSQGVESSASPTSDQSSERTESKGHESNKTVFDKRCSLSSLILYYIYHRCSSGSLGFFQWH
jgi:hypothetical protein